MLVICCLLLRVVFAAVALETLDMSQLGHTGESCAIDYCWASLSRRKILNSTVKRSENTLRE